MPRDPEEGSEVRTSERNSRVGVLGYLPIAISCTGDETLDQGRSMIKLSSGPESCTYLQLFAVLVAARLRLTHAHF